MIKRFSPLASLLAACFSLWINSSMAGPLAPVPPEYFSWGFDGKVESSFTVLGSPVPIAVGDAYSMDLGIVLDSAWTQCSPCINNGDREWRGSITNFSLEIAGQRFVGDVNEPLANWVIARPGDDATEIDTMVFRLGQHEYSLATGLPDPVRIPFSLVGEDSALKAAVYFYLQDFGGLLFPTGPEAWRYPQLPGNLTRASTIRLFLTEDPYDSAYEGALFDLGVDSIRAVPLPSSLLLFFIGGFMLYWSRNKKFVVLSSPEITFSRR